MTMHFPGFFETIGPATAALRRLSNLCEHHADKCGASNMQNMQSTVSTIQRVVAPTRSSCRLCRAPDNVCPVRIAPAHHRRGSLKLQRVCRVERGGRGSQHIRASSWDGEPLLAACAVPAPRPQTNGFKSLVAGLLPSVCAPPLSASCWWIPCCVPIPHESEVGAAPCEPVARRRAFQPGGYRCYPRLWQAFLLSLPPIPVGHIERHSPTHVLNRLWRDAMPQDLLDE